MKKVNLIILSLFSLTLIAYKAQAQYKWSAGYKTGAEIIDIIAEPHLSLKENLLWTNELFVSRMFRKRFEAEAAIRFNRNSYSDSFYAYDSYGPTSETHNINRISLQLTARYHLIQKAKYSIYGQMGTVIQKRIAVTEAVQYSIFNKNAYSLTTTYKSIQWFNRINIGAGVNYNLAGSIYCSFTAIVGYRTDSSISMNTSMEGNSAWCGNTMFGLGYRF